MSDLTVNEGPARVGEVSGEREWPICTARRGMRERGRPASRCASGLALLGEEAGLPENDTSGENGGEEGSAGEESWRGEMGRLREKGGGVVDEIRGDEWLEETGEMDGEDGPGVAWSVGAIDVGADGPCDVARSVVEESSTSFSREDKKLGSPILSPLVRRALELAALEDSPLCWAMAASS